MEPTNADLKEAFDAHAEDDARVHREDKKFQGEMVAFKAETEGSLANIHRRLDIIEPKIDGLATKEDTKEILETIRTIKFGFGLFKVSGRSIMFVGGVVAAILAITGGFKSFLLLFLKP